MNNQKTCQCLLLFSCSCINKQMIQSFMCIFKIVLIMRVKWGQHGTVLEEQLSLCIGFLSQLFTFTSEKTWVLARTAIFL